MDELDKVIKSFDNLEELIKRDQVGPPSEVSFIL
jgi:hypothetical protein